MDDKTLISLLDKQEQRLKEYIQTTNSLYSAKHVGSNEVMVERLEAMEERFHQEFQHINDQNLVRNSRLESVEDKSEKIELILKEEFRFIRWVHNNPWKSVLIAVMFFLVTAFGYNRIDTKLTVEKALPVVFKKNNLDVEEDLED